MANKGFIPTPRHKERQLDYADRYWALHKGVALEMRVRNRFKWKAWLRARTVDLDRE